MVTFINISELTDHLDQIVKYPDLRRANQSLPTESVRWLTIYYIARAALDLSIATTEGNLMARDLVINDGLTGEVYAERTIRETMMARL